MATEHTATATKRKEPSAKITIDALASLLDLPTWEKIDEMNREYVWDIAHAAVRFEEEHASNADERADAEEKYLVAEQRAEEALWRQWHGAILHAAESLFEAHGLELEACALPRSATGDALPFEFRIVPAKSWQDAAEEIRETVNGMGPFWFASVAEFIATTDGTARRTVLSHLGWIKHYPAVYGSRSAESLYEGAWS